MFEKEYDFGFSSLGKDGKVKISAVMNVLQDVSFAHADAVGLDFEKLKEDSRALLLSGWRVHVHKSLSRGTIKVKTGIMGLGTCDAVRRYDLYQDGELAVSATAVWFMVDTKQRKVTRIPEDYAAMFESVDEEDNGLPFGRILPSKETVLVDEFDVEPRDIDANNHFNNVKSIEKFLNLLPEGAEVEELQIKYRKEVRVHDDVRIFGGKSEKGLYFEIRNKDDALCTFAYVREK